MQEGRVSAYGGLVAKLYVCSKKKPAQPQINKLFLKKKANEQSPCLTTLLASEPGLGSSHPKL